MLLSLWKCPLPIAGYLCSTAQLTDHYQLVPGICATLLITTVTLRRTFRRWQRCEQLEQLKDFTAEHFGCRCMKWRQQLYIHEARHNSWVGEWGGQARTRWCAIYTRVRTSGINLNFCSNLSNDIYVLCPYSFASHSRTKHHFAILSDKSSFIFEPKQHSRLECHRVVLDYRSCMPIQINSQLLSVSFTVSSTGLELRRKTAAR